MDSAAPASPPAASAGTGAGGGHVQAVAVRSLRKSYDGVTAVDGISFEVHEGEIFGLLGPNGAGKTTTVEIIEGLRDADAGDVSVLGMDVRRERTELKQHIGVQLQVPSLFPRLSVLELLRLFATFYRQTVDPERLIADFGLEESRVKLVRRLSGGQQQRLSVALALINDPAVVFLDEPTNGLDPQARINLWGVIAGLRDRGKTILVTTHYIEEAERLCDRVAIIDRGRIVALGSPRELIRETFVESAVIFRAASATGAVLERLAGVTAARGVEGEWTLYSDDIPATMGALLSHAQERGITLEGLSVRGATLEDVFLKLTGRSLRD